MLKLYKGNSKYIQFFFRIFLLNNFIKFQEIKFLLDPEEINSIISTYQKSKITIATCD